MRVLPPVSLILATWSRDYIGSLTGPRYVGAPASPEARAGNQPLDQSFRFGVPSSDGGRQSLRAVGGTLQSSWRECGGHTRRDLFVHPLIDALPGTPMLTASTAAKLIGRSVPAASRAIEILVQVNVGRRNRTFEAPELIEAFAALERRLAGPTADTLASNTAHHVPPSQKWCGADSAKTL